MCVGVCVLLSWKHAAGLALQQLGGAMLHRGNLLVRLSSWCPWTPCWRSWSPSGWSRRWPPAPDWTRSGTETLTSAATSRPRGSSAAPRRLASPTASARPASRTPASPSSPSPADRGAFILLLKMTSLERNAVCVCVCVCVCVTLVVQVALSGSTSRSSLCRTALGHRDDSRASMRNVSI